MAPLIAAVVMLSGAIAAGILAQEGQPKPSGIDPELAAAIKRFDAAQGNIQRISAHFKEVKSLALLKEPVVQSGDFYHTKPDKFLWEYTNPTEKILMLNATGIIAYYPREK